MERETSYIAPRTADLFPLAIHENFAGDCAGCIFDQHEAMMAGNVDDPTKVARHAHLVHAENGTSFWGYGRLDQGRIDIERFWFDIDEHRYRATIDD